MSKKILILEDNDRRQAAMQDCLRDRFYQFDVVFFNEVSTLKAYCEEHLSEAILIVLDHDLELKPGKNGRCLDPGTGRDAADYLAVHRPVCPVVINTTNGPAGDGMEMALQEAHWETQRVVPAGDLEWIATTWFKTVRRAIVGKPSTAKKAVS